MTLQDRAIPPRPARAAAAPILAAALILMAALPRGPARAQESPADQAFLDTLQQRTFRYFWEEANPANGLVKDRSTGDSPASIAAVGFGLSAVTVGVDRGWITRAQGRERVLTTLSFLWESPQGPQANATGHRGFYYHFLDMDTGRRAWTSELSTIDTALLMAGVLHAGLYFDGSGPEETRIRELADALYRRVEWDWAAVRPPLISHGWYPDPAGRANADPGTGFIRHDYRGYSEAMILYLLALGSPTHPVAPEAWEAWTSSYVWESYFGYPHVRFPPLFGHQYSHVWVDFRGIRDAFMREKGIDYFENSRRATLVQQAWAVVNPGRFEGYGENAWGFTASDGPPSLDGYRARGVPGGIDDGTIAPTAAGGSYPFTPEASLAALRHMAATYGDSLYGAYGFLDAFNPSRDWVGDAYLGIDQGPILLMIENGRTGRIWEVFMQGEHVQRGLARAGFAAATAAERGPDAPDAALEHGAYPNPFGRTATVHFTLARPARVTLHVYDVLGRRVAALVDGRSLPAGPHAVVLDGSAIPGGLYLYRLAAEGRTASGVLVKAAPGGR